MKVAILLLVSLAMTSAWPFRFGMWQRGNQFGNGLGSGFGHQTGTGLGFGHQTGTGMGFGHQPAFSSWNNGGLQSWFRSFPNKVSKGHSSHASGEYGASGHKYK